MTPPHGVRLRTRLQEVQRVFPDGLEHGEAPVAGRRALVAYEAVIEERGEGGQDAPALTGDSLRRLDREAAGEDAESCEEPPLLRGQQPPAPVDRRAERSRALGEVWGAVGKEPQPRAEPAQQRVRTQHLHPGRGELQRERKTIEAPADLRDGRGVL